MYTVFQARDKQTMINDISDMNDILIYTHVYLLPPPPPPDTAVQCTSHRYHCRLYKPRIPIYNVQEEVMNRMVLFSDDRPRLENCTRVLIIMISFRYHCRCCRSENRMGSFQIGQQHVGRITENEDEELIDFPAECLDTTLM